MNFKRDDRVKATLLDNDTIRGRVYSVHDNDTYTEVYIVEDITEDMVVVPVEAVQHDKELKYLVKDGVDHINIYSQGQTDLGRFLSNFAYSPFTHPMYGEFDSVEGYWYYDLTGDEKLRNKYGYDAKKYGQEKCKETINGEWDVNRTNIKIAIMCKLMQCGETGNLEALEEFIESDLPFRHYYIFGGKVVEPKNGKWLVEYFEDLRKLLK